MLTKSSFLEYLIERAKQCAERGEKKSPTANHFFVALFGILSEKNAGKAPIECKSAEAEAELSRTAALLPPAIDFAAKAKEIEAEASADGYNASVDEFLYGKILYGATAEAEKQGASSVGADTVLSMILKEPTAAIRKHVLSGGEEKKGSESTDSTITWDDINSYFEQSSEEKKDKEPEMKEQKPTPAPQRTETGMELLARTVKETREIQTMLLDNVFGQDRAVATFVAGYFQAELMRESRGTGKKPEATFLFAGPPGVGKTFLAEKAAEALGLPYRRFDMSEYADKEANIEFCGSDQVYKNSKEGNVTGFVRQNPRCVLLFDEIEKAHINVIYLFLQILDAGRIRDNYTDEEVCFSDAVLIFTTNVGKNLYADPTVTNLSALPRKKILKALATDVDPVTKAPLFPGAICSRFASGNVVMFDHLGADNLYTIARRELDKNVEGFERSTGIKIEVDAKVPTAIMLSEGGKADARTVKGRANAFFHEELYELLRLLDTEKSADAVEKLKTIRVGVCVNPSDGEVSRMFQNQSTPEVLVFAERDVLEQCRKGLSGVTVHATDSIEDAKEILFNRDISIILCDVRCKTKDPEKKLLNAEDIDSVGRDFLDYVLLRYATPVYLIESEQGSISREEFLSFARRGVREVLTVSAKKENDFKEKVLLKCDVAYQQGNMLKLAKENKVLSYETAQTLSKNRKNAEIELFNFRLGLATDTEDSGNILDNVHKPSLHFADVIGAEDAKGELAYFVEYLRDPVRYMRKGVRAPKGILLYGPPGTGKTMLAKAMAGESDVTFLTAEGNRFLKKYVGEGAEAVHALFRSARKYAPSILFIDEIDAIGKDRNATGLNDSTSDVLTAFLTEMDGFNTDTSKPVFVLAATNYGVEPGKGKSLDAALLRRFDRRIYVDLPNKEERRRFLEMKMKGHMSVSLSDEQMDNIALRSTGMSLAELESIFEMALRSAIRSDSGSVGDAAFEEAFETYQSGEKKEWNPDSLLRTARHEAGHALLCRLGGERPTYLTIVARGDHGGYMQHENSEGKGLYTKQELLHKIRTALGGRAAEMVYYGKEEGISTGASGDLRSATSIAEQMICAYGMDETVGLAYIADPATPEVRARVNAVLAEQMQKALALIEENKAAIDKLVEVLLERNHLKGDEIEAILGEYLNQL